MTLLSTPALVFCMDSTLFSHYLPIFLNKLSGPAPTSHPCTSFAEAIDVHCPPFGSWDMHITHPSRQTTHPSRQSLSFSKDGGGGSSRASTRGAPSKSGTAGSASILSHRNMVAWAKCC